MYHAVCTHTLHLGVHLGTASAMFRVYTLCTHTAVLNLVDPGTRSTDADNLNRTLYIHVDLQREFVPFFLSPRKYFVYVYILVVSVIFG